MADSVQIPTIILGGIYVCVMLANLAQLISHTQMKRFVGTIPLHVQRTAVIVCMCYAIHVWTQAFGPNNRTTAYVSLVFCYVSFMCMLCECSFIVFEITRNAYLAMYLHAKTLSSLPSMIVTVVTILCLAISLLLQLIKNEAIYSSITMFAFAIFLYIKVVFSLYYCHQLVTAASGNPNSGSGTNALRSFYRFVWCMAPLLFALASLCVWMGIEAILASRLVFSGSDPTFDYIGALLVVIQIGATWWSWRPIRDSTEQKPATTTNSTNSHQVAATNYKRSASASAV